MWRQNARCSHTIANHAGCLVPKCFTGHLNCNEEIAIFKVRAVTVITQNLFYNEDFIHKLTYLVEIFDHLSNMNEQMQGLQISTLTQNNKVHSFMKKNYGK